MSNTTFIYVLREPDTGEIRYVGKSDNPEHRFRRHLTQLKQRSHKTYWIKSLVSRGLKPVMEIEDACTKEVWQSLEAAYIQFYREQGCDLTNSTFGGDGMIPTIEVRLKMRNAKLGKKRGPHSQEHREKIRLSQSGENNHHYGKPCSDEDRLKKSLALKGKPWSEARRVAQNKQQGN